MAAARRRLTAAAPHDVLLTNRAAARSLAERAGLTRTRKVLEKAERDLARRLAEAAIAPGPATFTHEQTRAALAQVRAVLVDVRAGLKEAVVTTATEAATSAALGTVHYLETADAAFRGVGTQPLALDVASVLDAAVSGAQASVLRRLATSGTEAPGAEDKEHRAKAGILQRYGVATIAKFEDVLQQGVLTRKSWADVRAEITAASPFLQGAPAYWAERIVRTETMGAYSRSTWEGLREADEQLGDMVKVLSATFDDRTAADSYAVHGQVRRPEQAFQAWTGLYQHPPNRPQDREIVVPHRLSWDFPPYLYWKTNEQVEARWRGEGRKAAMPPRPKMTTIAGVGRFEGE